MYMDKLKKRYLDNIKKEKTNSQFSNPKYDRIANIMHIIESIGGCEINDSLRIDEKKSYDVYGSYQGTHYSIYKDEILVFMGFISNDIHITFYKYIPGEWENELSNYLYNDIHINNIKELTLNK